MGGFWCYFLDFFGLASAERLSCSRFETAGRQSIRTVSRGEGDRVPAAREDASAAVRVAAA